MRVELTRQRYAAIEPRVGDSIFVAPRDLKVFLDQEQPVLIGEPADRRSCQTSINTRTGRILDPTLARRFGEALGRIEETKVMRSETIGLARLAVRQQVEIFGGDQVSLNSLWRAVGSPAAASPSDGPSSPRRCLPDSLPISTASRAAGLRHPAQRGRVVDLGGRIEGPVAAPATS